MQDTVGLKRKATKYIPESSERN